jgi:hypothetical protein
MQIKIKDANLYNCEGFMTDIELVDKINDTFKEDTEFGMTLAGLIEIAPRDFFLPVQGGEILFTKAEVNKVIKYLNAFDLTLKEMVRTNKYKRVYGTEESVLIEKTNLELEKKPTVEYGREPADAEVDQAFEEAEAFQNEVDEEATTPAAIQ